MTWNERDSAESQRDFQELKSSPRREMCLAMAHLILGSRESELVPTPKEINLRPRAVHHPLASNLGPGDNSYEHR